MADPTEPVPQAIVPVTTSGKVAEPPVQPGRMKRALTQAGAGLARLADQGRDGLEDGLKAAGGSLGRMHRRLALIALALFAVLLLGAAFRHLGWADGNYLLIGLVSAAAVYLLVSPVHVIGVLLAGGGLAAWKGRDEALGALNGYARTLGLLLLGFLTPLVVFALAPGDASFWISLRLILLTPLVVLAFWLFGRVAPRIERALLIGLPLTALVLAVGSMVIPERTLTALGVPAWLRADRPQDDELARLETALEARRNEERAARLRDIRTKIERGTALTAQDEAIIAEAQAERATFADWAGERYQAVLTEVARRNAASPRGKPAIATSGVITAPASGWSAPLAIPTGLRLCTATEAGEAAYVTQCATGEGPWRRRAAGGCPTGAIDKARFTGRGEPRVIRYALVPAASECSGKP